MPSFLNPHDVVLAGASVLFWISAGLIAYTYIGYPMLLRLLTIFIRRKPATPSDSAHLTLLICAHNEARSIGRKLEESLALNYPPDRLQILVVSDGSSDGTDEIVNTFASRGVELVRIAKQNGKTHAQNVAMERIRGEIVIFSDATTHYHPEALRFLVGNYADPQVGAVSGCYSYQDPTHASPNETGAKAYASYDNRVRNLQSQVWSISGCCGCIYSVRRSLYTPLEDHIISDLVQPLHVLRQGFRVTFEPRALAWETTTCSPRSEFSMRVRVVARGIMGLMSVSDLLRPWHSPWIALQLWSHKLLRWGLPLLLMILLACSVALSGSSWYRAALVLQFLLYGTAILTIFVPLHRFWRALGVPLYFCTANIAAVAGAIQYLRGKRYSAWQPQRESAYGSS